MAACRVILYDMHVSLESPIALQPHAVRETTETGAMPGEPAVCLTA